MGCGLLGVHRAAFTSARSAQGRSPRLPVRGYVVVALVLSVTVNVLLVDPPQDPLPGVALDSSLLLVVERVIALLAAWLAVGVVLAEAWLGRLPAARDADPGPDPP